MAILINEPTHAVRTGVQVVLPGGIPPTSSLVGQRQYLTFYANLPILLDPQERGVRFRTGCRVRMDAYYHTHFITWPTLPVQVMSTMLSQEYEADELVILLANPTYERVTIRMSDPVAYLCIHTPGVRQPCQLP